MERSLLPPELFGATLSLGRTRPERPSSPTIVGGPSRRLWVTANEAEAWLQVRGIGELLITSGSCIRVWPDPAASPRQLADCVKGIASALLLAQQGRFALHASALAPAKGLALAITGVSGAGKTATAVALGRRGWPMLYDEVVVVDVLGGRALASGSGRSMHLWPDVVQALDLQSSEGEPLGPDVPKLAFQVPEPNGRHHALVSVIVLEPRRTSEDRPGHERHPPHPELMRLPEAVGALIRNCYQWALLRNLYPRQILGWASALAETAAVHALARPEGAWTLEAMADAVQRAVRS